MKNDISISISTPAHQADLNVKMKIGLSLIVVAAVALLFGWVSNTNTTPLLITFLISITCGSLLYTYGLYNGKPAGIQNNGVMFKSISSRGLWAWVIGIALTSLYVLLYWYPHFLGLNKDGNTGIVHFFDPLSLLLNGKVATQWFVYGTLYTLAILLLGVKFIYKYRHSKYQVVRTISVMFFQLAFAFLIPEFLERLNPTAAYFQKDMKNMWPLNTYFTESWNINAMLKGGNLGMFMLILGIAMIFIISPILTFFYGKRWYCSWVCGCGGLAETAGDSFRHLSNKSTNAWKIERWMIYIVLALITVITVAVLFTMFYDNPTSYWLNKNSFSYMVIGFFILFISILFFKRKSIFKDFDKKAYYIAIGIAVIIILGLANILLSNGKEVFFIKAETLKSGYGFFIGSAFSGVIGVGFYPLLGSRVWCRFGCPMAAILGLQQKLFSRFRITTNGSQCISCGNCSTYCEMGIDVRAYAQKGMDIVRSSCVGCGVCSAVCPRGVLKLENGPLNTKKLEGPIQYNSGKFIIEN
jgi:polyferredoxin